MFIYSLQNISLNCLSINAYYETWEHIRHTGMHMWRVGSPLKSKSKCTQTYFVYQKYFHGCRQFRHCLSLSLFEITRHWQSINTAPHGQKPMVFTKPIDSNRYSPLSSSMYQLFCHPFGLWVAIMQLSVVPGCIICLWAISHAFGKHCICAVT